MRIHFGALIERAAARGESSRLQEIVSLAATLPKEEGLIV